MSLFTTVNANTVNTDPLMNHHTSNHATTESVQSNSNLPSSVRTSNSIYINYNNGSTYPFLYNSATEATESTSTRKAAEPKNSNTNAISNFLYSSLSPPAIDHSSLINSINSNFVNNSNKPPSHLSSLSNDDKVSAFLPYDEIISNDQMGSKNEIVCKILLEINEAQDDGGGHVDNIIRIMSFHPQFLQEFIRFYNFLMYSQGALSFDSRHYLAIMAAARHNCIYLVKQQEKEFQMQNGQKTWLNGMQHIPQKFKDLNELNKILCHQPWLLNRSHMDNLLNGKSTRWSITELIMAVTILTHFHALSGFVFGVGINENYMQIMQHEHNLNEIKRETAERLAAAKAKITTHSILNSGEFDDYNDEEESDEDDDEEEDYDENEDDFYYYDSNLNSNSNNFSSFSSESIFQSSGGGGNRTLSNSSSASSCEVGIDMLLKEMQMIKADDKNATSSQSLSSSLNNNRYMTSLLLSGTNTITNNSPILSSASSTHINHVSSYLSDLSNCSASSQPSHHNISTNSKTSNNVQNTDDSGMINDDELLFSNEDNENDSSDFKPNNCNSKILKKSRPKQSSISNVKPVSSPNASAAKPPCFSSANASDQLLNTSIVNAKMQKYLAKYAYDQEYGQYSNFKKADQSSCLEYYTWENHGYTTAYSFYPDLCELMDKNFKIASNMTYNTMGSHKHVDTSLFRRAVWHYIHSLFGVKYDDYDYNQIKLLLASPLRNYIKILCRRPEAITKKDYDSIMKEFTHSEKVHVNIVIMEARIQASMLYFLRAINSYFG